MIGKRNVDIVEDGSNLVLINDIVFKGKRNVDWDEVKAYLEQYIGTCYEIEETSEKSILEINSQMNIRVRKAESC